MLSQSNRIWEHGTCLEHYCNVLMAAMTSQITSIMIVCSTVHSGADQRKHQSSASLAFVRGIHRWPVNSPHKGQWRGALMIYLICAWISGCVNNGEAGGLRRHRPLFDVTVMVNLAVHSVLQISKHASKGSSLNTFATQYVFATIYPGNRHIPFLSNMHS